MTEQLVVIAGGGYSGVLAANRAHGKLRGHGRVVLIAPGDSLVQRIRLHEAAVHGTDVRCRYATLLARGIEHIDGRVVGLDTATDTLRLAVASTTRELRYAALVLAFGSRLAGQFPSRSLHADALTDIASAQRLARALPGLAPGSRVLVVGGGLTAIELSAELAETYPQLHVEMLASEFASGLAGPAAAALRAGLAALNVTVQEGVRVAALDGAGAQLADGRRIDAAISIRASGFEPAPLGPEFGLTTTPAGRAAVTPQLLAAGTHNVFVVGDSAAPPLAANGQTTRMACATAMPLGAHAGDQVARLLSGDALQPLRFGYVLQCISLGRHSGVVVFVDADDRPTGRVITGRTAALVKELICRSTIGFLKLERMIAGVYNLVAAGARLTPGGVADMTHLSSSELACERTYLLGIAYRILGSASDAEDIVQEALVRAADRSDLRSPRAFLTTVVTRLCLDELGSARRRRESYVGPNLPEPMPTDRVDDGSETEQRETVSLALLVVLDELSPLERAVFVLRDVFDLEFGEIAAALERSEPACRKLLQRARERIEHAGNPQPSAADTQSALANAFFSALASGDLQGLVDLLAQEATLRTDHGGKVSAIRRTLNGRDVVARCLYGLYLKGQRHHIPYQLASTFLNGAPGLVLRGETGAIEAAFILQISGSPGAAKIDAVRVMRNPDKLQRLERALAEGKYLPVAPTAHAAS